MNKNGIDGMVKWERLMVPNTMAATNRTRGVSFRLTKRLNLGFMLLLVCLGSPYVHAGAVTTEAAAVSRSFELLKAQTLLLDLAGVSPVFTQNYQDLLALQSRSLTTEDMAQVARMQQQILAYWHYIANAKQCIDCKATDVDPIGSREYLALLNKINQLVELDTTPWDTLTLEAKLTLGQEHPFVPTIAERLWMLGYLSSKPSTSTVYNPELEQGIKQFQRQHGLQADGVIGKQSLYWLNQSPRARARLLARNEIRKRVFNQALSARYLLINVPAFDLQLVEQGAVVLHSKVIVGKPSRATPLLDSQISSVVMNPDWRVPRSIIQRDILPHIQENGHYLSEREFDVYNYNGLLIQHSAAEWQSLAFSDFPYRLVQRPGPKNALGKYKFHFDNSFSVYLHGTSEPKLFNKNNRALSSGCIRVEKVEELALWFKTHLVKDKTLWDRLEPDVTSPQWFSLSDKLPVHLVYWTAWLDEQGQLQYRNDIYHLEAEFTNAVPAAIFHVV